MTILVSGILFWFGALVASFLGVVVERMYTGQSFVRGRSRCDACGTPLSLVSLVPIISYVSVRGQAVCCGARIPVQTPIFEIVTGTLFVVAYFIVGMTVALPFLLVAFSLIVALVAYDLKHQILPGALLYPFIGVSAIVGYQEAESISSFYAYVGTALLIAGVFYLVHLFSRGRAIGFADIPFMFGLALLVGPAAITGLVFSFWIGASIGIFILFRRPAGSRMGIEVPFAPYLAAGFLLAYCTQWNPFALMIF